MVRSTRLEKTLELYPERVRALIYHGDAYVVTCRYEDDFAFLEKVVSLTGERTAIVLGVLGCVYRVAGKKEDTQEF